MAAMQRFLPGLLLLFLGAAATAQGLPVFPGAQGFGTQTRAAYGGAEPPAILRVTNLNDSGPGSLRAALEASGPRVVIFEVGGTIALQTRIRITSPYLTIAGQTAPSPGITIRDEQIVINTHDVLAQHFRIRIGDGLQTPSAATRDAIAICCGRTYNIVLDHLSLGWAIDEVLAVSAYGPEDEAYDITISNSIVAEGLHDSIHPKGPHSAGALIAPGVHNIAFLGNVFAHNANRNPLFQGNTRALLANNVFYNWRSNRRATIFSDPHEAPEGPFAATIVGNLYLRGPDTPEAAWAVGVMESVSAGSQLYLADNTVDGVMLFRNDAPYDPLVHQPPVSLAGIDVYASANLLATLLPNVGARPRDRDAVDARVLGEILTRGGRIIDSQAEVGGWPAGTATRPLQPPVMPHEIGASGYTLLEEWLHAQAHGLISAPPQPPMGFGFDP